MSTADAAALLADAYRIGTQIEALPADLCPQTLEEGYDIQDRLVKCLETPVAGWKLGVGSPRAKSRTGVERTIAGRILKNEVYAPGAAIRLPNQAPVTIEFEIAFVVACDISPSENVADPLTVVSETRVAFEVVLSRFIDRRAVGWPSFAADNSAFQSLVLGEAVDQASLPNIARSLVVEADGIEQARAETGENATVPTDSLADLLALSRERGTTLAKGSIVSTGSMSTPFNLSKSTAVRARYLDKEIAFSILRP